MAGYPQGGANVGLRYQRSSLQSFALAVLCFVVTSHTFGAGANQLSNDEKAAGAVRLKNAIRMLDGCDVAIVIFDHFD